MEPLQKAARAAVARHGGVLAAARAIKVDPASMSRLSSGKKTDVTDQVARKLGVRRVVRFEPLDGVKLS